MKKFKNVLLMSLVATTVLTTPIFAQTNSQENVVEDKENYSIQSRIYFNEDVRLSEYWTTVTRSNNLFNDNPKVVNNKNNPGILYVRIIDQHGNQVGREKAIQKGDYEILDDIPFNSGTYTVECKVSTAGVYKVYIN
ncbi:hypothetical protein [uncultured Tyzzerella sp.]|uniref:hypothetical protein n=1 Tax=uncultured Tyzzerella sp. TaxID=2321398 RepID=UPI0029430D31|nr:hypothetical protein [uncultured Tyzzerella sp.]